MTVERNVQPQRDSPGGFHNSTSRGEQPATRGAAAGARGKAAVCLRCGAMRCELGQEPTVERYLANLVSVFDAVRRVLRRDGLCWVNLAGSYFNNPGGQNGGSAPLNNGTGTSTLGGRAKLLAQHRISAKTMEANRQAGRQDRIGAAGKDSWLKPLDWVDTPGLFAHAMQRAGWWWRADIALIKVNPLPESVSGWKWERCKVKVAPDAQPGHLTVNGRALDGGAVHFDDRKVMAEWADCPGCSRCTPNDGLILRRGNGRPTRSWERFLVFAKAPGAYWDSDAVREPPSGRTDAMRFWKKGHEETARSQGLRQDGERVFTLTGDVGRNLKDWQFWPTSGGVGGLQHFAAFPLGLPSLAIRAGTSERGVCPKCQAPWARVVERVSARRVSILPADTAIGSMGIAGIRGNPGLANGKDWYEGGAAQRTTAWRPTCPCGHDAPAVPAVVLDPFVGAGTTLIAADRLGRSALGIDVQPTYIDLAAGRAQRDAPLLATVEVERQAEQASKQRDLFSVLGEQMDAETEAAGG